MKEIPPDHLYHKLRHPIVIGHMGNILKAQENSLEGISSLIEIKAGGVHLHVRLTRDDKLILFQDNNLYVSRYFKVEWWNFDWASIFLVRYFNKHDAGSMCYAFYFLNKNAYNTLWEKLAEIWSALNLNFDDFQNDKNNGVR